MRACALAAQRLIGSDDSDCIASDLPDIKGLALNFPKAKLKKLLLCCRTGEKRVIVLDFPLDFAGFFQARG